MKHASFSHGHVHFTVGVGMRQINLAVLCLGKVNTVKEHRPFFLEKRCF